MGHYSLKEMSEVWRRLRYTRPQNLCSCPANCVDGRPESSRPCLQRYTPALSGRSDRRIPRIFDISHTSARSRKQIHCVCRDCLNLFEAGCSFSLTHFTHWRPLFSMHFLHYIALGLMSTIAALGQDKVTATVNGTEMQQAADQLLSAFPSATPYTVNYTAPGGNLIQPPSSLINDIITAVPPTVLAQLLMPTGRSSIASEFSAGNTPSWYQDLPSEVKSYVLAMKSQAGAGNVDLNATRTPAPTSSASADSKDGEGDDSSDSGDGPATETSSGLAPHATGEVAASLLGALGLLGLAVVL